MLSGCSSAVLVSPPVLAIMMWLAAQPRITDEFAIGLPLKIGGWIAAVIMLASVVAMAVTAALTLA
jgi:hypothetical protein